MRIFKRILFYLFLLLSGAFVFVYVYLQMQKPVYSGKWEMPHLGSTVTVYFDTYGVPHIYGQKEEDVFRVLGYLHAKERLFQMELARRVSSGRLSEIFGSKTLEADKFFRMLGINRRASESYREFMVNTDPAWKKDMLAYVDGVNHYIETKRKRFEFLLLDIPKEKFSVKDIYLIADFMSFNFQMAFKTDPLMSRIGNKWGANYLHDLGVMADMSPLDSAELLRIDTVLSELDEMLPLKIWTGSNAWAISAERSSSGRVLFENDTHVGVQQPAVWYEAHLECPTFSIYGSFLAGFPFPALGHNRHHAWGLTILENDDLDFFAETVRPGDTTQVKCNDSWEKIQVQNEIIYVKDSTAVILPCRSTQHGPVCSDIMPEFSGVTSAPVSVCWTLLKFPANLPEITWRMATAKSMSEFRYAVSMIVAPGLNVVYGDADNNIAWYAAARMVRRPPGINPNVVLNGSGSDDWLGYYDFSENPQAENPTRGVVLSANNPVSTDSVRSFPGYYLSPDRLVRINHFLHSKKILSLADVQLMNTDVTNPVAAQCAQMMLEKLPGIAKLKTQIHERAAEILDQWNGSHELEDIAPVIYYKWLYHILQNAMEDEMGEKDFQAFLKTHVEKNAIKPLLQNEASVWWDNVNTLRIREKEKDILQQSYDSTIAELISQFGPNPVKWTWKKVHTLEIEHVLGKQKPLDKLFNIGPYPEPGGIETINNQGFELNQTGKYKVNLAPALRRSLDFANPETGYNVIPSGQSGNFMSRYYDNQIKLYINGKVRKEMMNRKEIENSYTSRMTFVPSK
jgi:penicillin amidase